MQIVYFIVALIIIWIIFGWFYKKQDGVLSSVVFTIINSLIVWLNLPLLVTIPENAIFDSWLAKLPFELYAQFGMGYYLACNTLLAVSSATVTSALSKKESKCSKKTINKCFNNFIENATYVKIIGKDLDFLLRKDCKRQKERLLDLNNQVDILCSNPYHHNSEYNPKTVELIALYHELSKSGNRIRFYDNQEGIKNLLGQIKVDDKKNESGLFVQKIENKEASFFKSKSKFKYEKQLNGYLLEGVIDKFDETFNRALNPIVKFIALDIGGVYLDGDIDTFLDYLNEKYEIKIPRKTTDRIDLNTYLTIGKISILEYVKDSCEKRSKFHVLSNYDKRQILTEWNNTWKKDEKMYTLIEKILSLGFEVIPFSNVDKSNGERYLRENYFPSGCRYHVFSYEKRKSKSQGELFDEFFKTVNHIIKKDPKCTELSTAVKPYQILLIDDQQENINIAERRGWETIHFDRKNHNIDYLIQLLKEKALLPQNYYLE